VAIGVEGGVADYYSEGDVQVFKVDWDDLRDMGSDEIQDLLNEASEFPEEFAYIKCTLQEKLEQAIDDEQEQLDTERWEEITAERIRLEADREVLKRYNCLAASDKIDANLADMAQ
jgi:hypothetical protein